MAPASRIGAIAGRIPLQATSLPNYTCLRYRLYAHRASQKINTPIKHPARKFAFDFDTKYWRKKIWGTETPPGQEDPYGPPSALDLRRMEQYLEGEGKVPQEEEKRAEVPFRTEDGVEDDVDTASYEPATTWKGLPRIGGENWAKNKFAASQLFEGFIYSKLETREEIIMAVHQALVEVFTLKQAGLSLVMSAKPSTKLPPNKYLRWLAEHASFEKDEKGETRLVLESDELHDAILDSITPKRSMGDQEAEGDVLEEQQSIEGDHEGEIGLQRADGAGDLHSSSLTFESQGIDPDRAEELKISHELHQDDSVDRSNMYEHDGPVSPANNSWREVSLEDQELKFAASRGSHRFTAFANEFLDPEIASITNSKVLLTHVAKKPKPKSLTDSLVSKQLAELPNVQISKRRHGLVDKEKEIGRWKVIKQELERLGLQTVKGRGDGRNAVTMQA